MTTSFHDILPRGKEDGIIDDARYPTISINATQTLTHRNSKLNPSLINHAHSKISPSPPSSPSTHPTKTASYPWKAQSDRLQPQPSSGPIPANTSLFDPESESTCAATRSQRGLSHGPGRTPRPVETRQSGAHAGVLVLQTVQGWWQRLEQRMRRVRGD